jgi:hypothetical protein
LILGKNVWYFEKLPVKGLLSINKRFIKLRLNPSEETGIYENILDLSRFNSTADRSH